MSDMVEDVGWWGWDFERQRWFPCLDPRYEESVSPDGVIVHCRIEDREARRNQLMIRVRDAIAAAEPHLRQKHRQELLDELIAKSEHKAREDHYYWGYEDVTGWLREQKEFA